MKIGVIGTGNMGRILVEALIEGNAISPSSMMIINRTKSKAALLKDKYEGIQIGNNVGEVAKKSDLLFICVKPLDVYSLLQEIRPYLSEEQCVISITSPIRTDQIETNIPCSVVRVIPSITNRALAGVSLLTFGDSCSKFWRETIEELFAKISVPVQIEEKFTRVSSDIVSCGPAFFSYLLEQFIQAAVKVTGMEEKMASQLASEMIIGLGELIKQKHYTLSTLTEKVCVKGGITGEGINVLERELGDVFEKLFQATNEKFTEDLEKINETFSPS